MVPRDKSYVQKRRRNRTTFFTSGECSYTSYDYLDHGYLQLPRHRGYIYNYTSATTPVNNVHAITYGNDTLVVIAGGKRRKQK
jgi:hypothetical protein